MRNLTIKEINEFAKREGVKKIAVENFLITICNNKDERMALNNLFLDAKLYNWNNKTVSSIFDGIRLAFK